MASPGYTGGPAGNGRPSATLAAGASATAFVIDATTSFEARLQVGCTFGTVAATAGLQVNIFEEVGSTPVADTVASPGSFTIPAATSSSPKGPTVHLPTGKWSVVLTNLDATNAVTSVYATYDLTPTVA